VQAERTETNHKPKPRGKDGPEKHKVSKSVRATLVFDSSMSALPIIAKQNSPSVGVEWTVVKKQQCCTITKCLIYIFDDVHLVSVLESS
jgi:hypothetical protein